MRKRYSRLGTIEQVVGQSRQRSLLCIGLATVAAAFATGCNSATVDTGTIEKQIQQQIVVGQATVTGVDCPEGEKIEKGATFDCAVAFSNDSTGEVRVEQSGFAHYTYAFVPGSLQVPGPTAEAKIKEDLATQGVSNASVNCPDNIIVKVGTYVVCEVSAGGRSGTVKFTFSSASGTVDTSSVEASS